MNEKMCLGQSSAASLEVCDNACRVLIPGLSLGIQKMALLEPLKYVSAIH